MATILKLLYSSYLANIIGGGIFSVWLFVDFNDIKLIVLGIMSMVWATGWGLLSLYRLWIKIQREKVELEYLRKNLMLPEIPKEIKSHKK